RPARHRPPLRQRPRTARAGSGPIAARDRPRPGGGGGCLPPAAGRILAIFLTMHLSGIDLFIVALYIVGTTLLVVWCTRGQRDIRTYFVGDRNVSWWLVLISIVATETSTVTFLSVPGMAFNPNGGNF